MTGLGRRAALAGAVTAVLAPGVAAQPVVAIGIFAAVSLQDALRALEPAWRDRAGMHAPLRFSFAASSTLARQIEQGAPADFFGSADEAWMDYLEQRALIAPGTRISLLTNSLVLVAPANGAATVQLTRGGTDLRALLGDRGRIALADPAHVPAGRYAQAALTWLGQWDALSPRLARADNVRAALLLVERGEAPLGIVYGSDALAAAHVRVLGTFQADSHPPITYPFALTSRAAGSAQARALLALLASPDSDAIWRRFGFAPAR